ncbi:hypothetical protein [Mycolicibacterium litorale]|nr:hypothetical protein [Mycolicibacterium litorale]MCV7416421.1 hypothetical protein [Mycolicibacterium litorale]TDY09675.1 hypothetical protein BCL50_1769 [Mycolicibacterium litorale]
MGAAATLAFIGLSLRFGLPTTAAGFLGLTAFVLLNLSPKLSLCVFLSAICFVPYWWGIDLFGYVPAASLISLMVFPGALLRAVRGGNYAVVAVLSIGLFVGLLVALGASIPGHGFVLLAQWVPAFFVGYSLTTQVGIQFVRDTITIVFLVVALLAIVEYLADWNPYFGTAPATEQYLKLGTLQDRGGITRSEGSFAHSIALANSLALAIPMVLTSRFRPVTQATVTALIIVAIFTTFSRSGLVTAGLALAFTLWASHGKISRRTRTTVALGVLATAAVALPWVEGVFNAASQEATRSANHRLRLLELVPYLEAFGTARGYHETAGVFQWFGVVSIDNAFLRLAVNFGWALGSLFLLAAAWTVFRAVNRKANSPEIALASVMPALLTVALITQFGILVWFYMGVAVATTELGRAHMGGLEHEDSREPAFVGQKGMI